MSWAASAYLPSRRSRSRSPHRGSYPPRPPYPDHHGPDPYRGDWESWDRERAYAIERDRAMYEYGRRGRSRSPDDAGRKRRRSTSPYERDSRPRYEDYDSRGPGFKSPRRASYHNAPSRRAPLDPHTMDYPASLKQYAEWFRFNFPQAAAEEDSSDKAAQQQAGDGTKPRNGIKLRWEKYKKQFTAQQLQTMFDHHRKSPWFAEKYDPSAQYAYLRKRVRKEGWKGRLNTFLDNLDAGLFDPQPADLSQPSSAKESVFVKKDDAKEDHDALPDNDGLAPVDESMKVEDDVEDEGDKIDTNGKTAENGKKGDRDRGEEVSVPPEGHQVMIRTIPPDIGRIKLETVGALETIPGFVYLALGDPLQKRNFYRAGWLKFHEDADINIIMSELSERKIDGFKLHVLHNKQPFKNRVRYAPEVASRPDILEKDLDRARTLLSHLEAEYHALRRIRILSRDEVAALPEGPLQEDTVSFAEGEDHGDPEPSKSVLSAVEERAERVFAELPQDGLDDDDLKIRKTVISLDLALSALRSAFHTCYYCAVTTDHQEELQRKCIKHLRKPLSKAVYDEYKAKMMENSSKVKEDSDMQDDSTRDIDASVDDRGRDGAGKDDDNREWKKSEDRWIDWLDSKLALLLERDAVDPRAYGGKAYDEELSKIVEPYIKQEDEGKYRCKTCQKLFKATSFVEKHIANKHTELIKSLDDLPYFNNFALDPHHIQPYSHLPQSGGSGQQAPPQAYGLPGPPPMPATDYMRGPNGGVFYPPYPPSGFPPAMNMPQHWDPYVYAHMSNVVLQPRRDDGIPVRRLSDRISGYAPGLDYPSDSPVTIPASAGLPAKPTISMDQPLSDDRGRRGPNNRRNTRSGEPGGPPPPPPPDAKEDPRAAAGRKVSYHDMDLVAEGDVELQY
ncbi:hypothetical protein BC834DRAFT_951531 [Gloeopeniophorella convolvens]|nr:hypothetical protein BC834DRAFT_951531 [Gloeopeniophorella convolvens]